MAHLELNAVRKVFGDDVAVDGVSLSVERGELLVLLGPSGCGKSTTLNMIAGFLEPDGGDILLNGSSIVDVKVHRRNIGVVFQSYSLFPHLTVEQNTAFGLRRRRVPDAEVRQRVASSLELVEMGGFVDRFPDQLSGGQQQRVAIARALVIDPDLLLLDEPLSNLDAKLREEMRDQIRTLVTETGVTTLFVTHDQEEALTIADRIGVMHTGELRQLAPPREVYAAPADLTVGRFIGRSNLIRGTLRAASSGIATIETENGVRYRGRENGQVTIGQQVVGMVRPEAIRLTPNGMSSDANSVDAVLMTESFLGQNLELRFDVHDGLTVVSQQQAFDVQPGTPCRLSWEIQDMVLFPAEA